MLKLFGYRVVVLFAFFRWFSAGLGFLSVVFGSFIISWNGDRILGPITTF